MKAISNLIDLVLTTSSESELTKLAEWRNISPDKDIDTHQIIKRGDIWLLGDHRLLCGDSTNAYDVNKLLMKDKPHLLISDPPYGINYDASWRNRVFGGNRAVGVVKNDQYADWTNAWRLFPGDVAYIWHAGLRSRQVEESLETAGFELRAQIIWVKSRFVIGRGHYHPQHEPCFYAVRKGKQGHWNGARDQTTIWNISHIRSETGHSTQKPIQCMAIPIKNNSQEGDSVYEPFSGSGTTIIAAESLRRKCYAIEIDPRYVYITLLRYQEQTGKSVSLEETGESFAEVVARRKAEPIISPASSISEHLPCKQEVGGESPSLGTNLIDLTFDPVLVEYIYACWSQPGNNIIDPHPDPVRGAVAQAMGRTYNAARPGLLLYCPTPQAERYAAWLGDALATVRTALQRAQSAVCVVEDVRHQEAGLCNAPYHMSEVFLEAGCLLQQQLVVQNGTRHSFLFAFSQKSV